MREPAQALSQASPRPVLDEERVPAMDVIRGVALLGILLVNIEFFAAPFTAAFSDEAVHGLGGAELTAWWLSHTFVHGKFISLFSLLFGAGIALQAMRSDQVRSAMRTSLLLGRRLLFLACVGLLHATLIWYGDILFAYASIGWILIPARFLPARVLGWAGIACLTIAVGCTAGLAMTSAVGAQLASEMASEREGEPRDEDAGSEDGTNGAAVEDGAEGADASDEDRDVETDEATSEPAPLVIPDAPTSFELMTALGAETHWSVLDPRWEPFEIATTRHGPAEVAIALRSLQWASTLPIIYVGYGFHLVGMFLVGTAIARLGLLSAVHAALQRRVALLCIPIGAIASAVVPTMIARGGSQFDYTIAGLQGVLELGTSLLAIGYAAGLARFTAVGPAAVVAALARTGRMAFTIYLLMSVSMTGLFSWWGFGLFNEVGEIGRLAIAFGTWLVFALAAQGWLYLFAMGPLEWIWRAATYLRLPRLLRTTPGSV